MLTLIVQIQSCCNRPRGPAQLQRANQRQYHQMARPVLEKIVLVGMTTKMPVLVTSLKMMMWMRLGLMILEERVVRALTLSWIVKSLWKSRPLNQQMSLFTKFIGINY
jgi:hypothetical protein